MPADRLEAVPGRLRSLVPLLARGLNNDELADGLSFTKHTIENYVSELKDLLGVRDRVALVDTCRGLLADGN